MYSNMKVKFNILNQEIDLTNLFIKYESKEWWFRNCRPTIPLETKLEDLTNEQKIALIKLAIYEERISTESLYNLTNECVQIIEETTFDVELKKEYQELTEKIDKLKSFLDDTTKHNNISKIQLALLTKQLETMKDYLRILSNRISFLNR